MRHRKTQTLFVLCLGVLLGGCRTSDMSIMVHSLRPLDEDCKPETEYVLGKGALNINASSTYLLSVQMESLLEGVAVEGAGGHLLSSDKENRVILTEWKRQYFIYGIGGTSRLIEEESEPLAGILDPNAQTQLLIPLSMIGPSGARTVRNILRQASGGGAGVGEGGPVGAEVVVRFQIQGRVVSSGKKIETAPVEFPVFVYLGEALPQCEEGESLAPVGPCGLHGGQDAFVPICCVLNPSSGECEN